MRKITLLAAACAAVIASSAYAQTAKAEGWTGCYAGGEVGAAWNSTTVTDEASPYPVIATLSNANITGGGRVGCDLQVSGPVVIGVLGSFDWTGNKATVTSPVLTPSYLTGKVSRVATVDARIGYLLTPNTLGYAKVGLALTRTNATLTGGGAPANDSASFSQSGISAGGGVEQRVGRNFSVFAEYNYYGANNKIVYFPDTVNVGVDHQNNQSFLLGFNYRFWGK